MTDKDNGIVTFYMDDNRIVIFFVNLQETKSQKDAEVLEGLRANETLCHLWGDIEKKQVTILFRHRRTMRLNLIVIDERVQSTN